MLVARQHELTALEERLADRRPAVLVGEAGIGKTTLLRAAAAATALPVYEGGGLASLSWRAYVPITRACGVEPPDGDSAFVAEWLVGRVGSGVLLVDDLHWADPGSLGLLPLIAGRVSLLGAVRQEDAGAAAVIESCEDAGIECVSVPPLSEEEADELLRQRRPQLGAAVRGRIAATAGGNALLLEQLAEGDGRVLDLGLTARVQRCPPEARTSLATLGLLSRPCSQEELDGDVELLRRLGLVEDDATIRPRHVLLADAAVRLLTVEERTAIHARLASRLDDPGEAARHALAAGKRTDARELALRAAAAATRRADRAQQLATAALASTGEQDDALRLEAARELAAVGEFDLAVSVVSDLGSTSPESRAEAHLLRARRHLAKGDTQAFRSELARGLWLVRGSGLPIDARLQLELAHDAASISTPTRAVVLARRAWHVAHAAGVETARADAYLGEALSCDGSGEGIHYLERGMEGARRDGDVELELETALDLVGAVEHFRTGDEAMQLVNELIARSETLRSSRWSAQFRWLRTRHRIYVEGRLGEGIDELFDLQDDRSLGIDIDHVRADLAIALADRGRDAEAMTLLDRFLGEARSAWGQDVLTLSRMEADWLAGRFDDVLVRQPELQKIESLAEVARGWSAFEAGRVHEPVPIADLDAGALEERVGPELEGLALLRAGAAGAVEKLLQAATAWSDWFIRRELACRWGAGEAARLVGDGERALELLVDVEPRCERLGFVPLARRTRRSLRLLGYRTRGSAASRSGLLTDRELEVLTLVAEGLSTRAIAGRLFISPDTVDAHVRAARKKLRARTRTEAAARALEITHATADRR